MSSMCVFTRKCGNQEPIGGNPFRTSFPLRDTCKNSRSMYARVPHVMAQFVLIIERLSLCYKDSPNTRNGANLRSPFPIMAPLRYHLVWKIAFSLTVCNKEIMRAIQSTSVAAEAE